MIPNRKPTQQEIDDLTEEVWTQQGNDFPPSLPNADFGKVIKAVENAHIEVYEYCFIYDARMKPKYVGKVMTIIWGDEAWEPGEPDETYIWENGKLVKLIHNTLFWRMTPEDSKRWETKHSQQ